MDEKKLTIYPYLEVTVFILFIAAALHFFFDGSGRWISLALASVALYFLCAESAAYLRSLMRIKS